MDAAIADRDERLAQLARRFAETDELAGARAAAITRLGEEIREHTRRTGELEAVIAELSERVVAGGRELARTREELEALRAEREERVRSLAVLAEELERLRAQARGQATRIRLRALRDAAELEQRLEELLGSAEVVRGELIAPVREAIARLGEVPDLEKEVEAGANGHRPRRAAELFAGRIEVEIGPLDDFSQLVGFEDAAGGIGATSEISVKRFTHGRATLEMRLAEPVELLRELEERAPFEFRVRDRRGDRIVLDVEG